MAVTHAPAVRTALANFIVDQLDTGTPPGKIFIQTSGGTEVANLTFANPAFDAAASGVAASGQSGFVIISDTDANGGTAAKFELRQGNGTVLVLGSVTATGGGGDITLNSITVSAGQTVALTSLTYTSPP